MILNGGIRWAQWPTSWGDMFDDDRAGHTGDSGVDAYSELSQYVPGLGIDSIMLINGETGIMGCFWAKPKTGVRVLDFEAVVARYFSQFERLLKSAKTWLSLPIEQRQSISWKDPSDDRVQGYKIRKCVALYTTSGTSRRQFPVDSEFLRFKEYVYQRVVGKSIFSRVCFQIEKAQPRELFELFLAPSSSGNPRRSTVSHGLGDRQQLNREILARLH